MQRKQKTYTDITIQRYFNSNFIIMVLIPIIVIFFIGMSLVLREVESDQAEQLETASQAIAGTLGQELSIYARELSRFILFNNKEALQLLTDYSTSAGTTQYLLGQELDIIFNANISTLEKFISADFYTNNGTKFSFLNQYIKNSVDITSTNWYLDTIENRDLVRSAIIESDKLFQPLSTSVEYYLLFSIAMDTLGRGNDVELGVVCVESIGLAMIQTKESDISVYLVDENSEIMVSSSNNNDSYIHDILQGNSTNSNEYKYHITNIPKTKWNVIAISDSDVISQSYQNIMGLIILGVFVILLLWYLFLSRMLQNIITPIKQLSLTMDLSKSNSDLEECNISGLHEIMVIGESYNAMICEINNLISANEIKEKEKLAEAIKALELQLNPHFLSNTLGSIRFMAVVAQFEGIQKMTEALITILNTSFRNKESFHTLGEELLVLESYVYIMRIRYANSFDVLFNVDSNCNDIQVPKLLLQPFLENAITHGLEHAEEPSNIDVNIKKHPSFIHFEIIDYGCGIDKERIETILNKEVENGKTIGIANINKRLQLYYGKKYRIHIDSAIGKYTKIHFNIPYEEERNVPSITG